jgi:F-type H+-transporting ATPase subunit alpha
LLKQAQFSPLPFEEQTASIYAGTNGHLDAVGVNDVVRYEEAMLSHMRNEHADVLKTIRDSGDLADDTKASLEAALAAFGKTFS